MDSHSIFEFPRSVNEVSARLVAAGVVLLTLATIVLDQPWITVVIAYGFVARVLTGPTLSPLGQLATRVITPRLHVQAKMVPGPPKRFAQGMGVVMSVAAAVLALGFGLRGPAYLVLGILATAAIFEAVLGFCLGCRIYRALTRLGVIPASACQDCNDISRREPGVPHEMAS